MFLNFPVNITSVLYHSFLSICSVASEQISVQDDVSKDREDCLDQSASFAICRWKNMGPKLLWREIIPCKEKNSVKETS